MARAVCEPGRTLVVHYTDKFETIPAAAVRDFIVFDSRSQAGAELAISAKLSLFT